MQSDDGKKAWLGQPTIIKSLEKQFGERVAKKKMTVAPKTTRFIGGKVDDISKVDEKTQSMYRSGVGTLLYLTKHSRPDITNPVRELSKSIMYSLIRNLVVTRDLETRHDSNTGSLAQNWLVLGSKTVRTCFGHTYVRRACFAR